jgi:hypothetical protein
MTGLLDFSEHLVIDASDSGDGTDILRVDDAFLLVRYDVCNFFPELFSDVDNRGNDIYDPVHIHLRWFKFCLGKVKEQIAAAVVGRDDIQLGKHVGENLTVDCPGQASGNDPLFFVYVEPDGHGKLFFLTIPVCLKKYANRAGETVSACFTADTDFIIPALFEISNKTNSCLDNVFTGRQAPENEDNGAGQLDEHWIGNKDRFSCMIDVDRLALLPNRTP